MHFARIIRNSFVCLDLVVRGTITAQQVGVRGLSRTMKNSVMIECFLLN